MPMGVLFIFKIAHWNNQMPNFKSHEVLKIPHPSIMIC